ncbi:hypothetical protein SprV_0902748600 [Sparganum proliferum]
MRYVTASKAKPFTTDAHQQSPQNKPPSDSASPGMLQSEWCAKQVQVLTSTRDERTQSSSVQCGGGGGGGGDDDNNPPINWSPSDQEGIH